LAPSASKSSGASIAIAFQKSKDIFCICPQFPTHIREFDKKVTFSPDLLR